MPQKHSSLKNIWKSNKAFRNPALQNGLYQAAGKKHSVFLEVRKLTPPPAKKKKSLPTLSKLSFYSCFLPALEMLVETYLWIDQFLIRMLLKATGVHVKKTETVQ